MTTSRAVTLAAVVVLGTGCAGAPAGPPSPAPEPSAVPRLVVDSATVTCGRIVRISVIFRNDGRAPFYLEPSSGVSGLAVEKRHGDGWLVAFAPLMSLGAGPPEVVVPGGTARRAVVLDVLQRSPYPRWEGGNADGSYRAVSMIYRSWKGAPDAGTGPAKLAEPEEPELLVTAPFTLQPAAPAGREGFDCR